MKNLQEKGLIKNGEITFFYLPIQKSLNIDPSISSTSTFPTIIPRCLAASLKSSAPLSKSFCDFCLSKFLRWNIHGFKLSLCLLLEIKVSSKLINLFFKLSLILFINLSKLISSFIDI